jgi:transcriptional regulator with XRE-family HTH domain
MATFGERLKELREHSGLSQDELADMAGIHRVQVSRLETGSSVPSWPTVQALARALGVDCKAFEQEPSADTERPRPGRPRKAEPVEKKPKRPRGRPRKAEGRS